MTFTVLVFATRKQGITPAEFKEIYELHVPLVKSLSGHLFPKSHTRFYVQRTQIGDDQSDKSNKAYPAAVMLGTQEEFYYDAYAELVFDNEQAFQQFIGCVTAPEAAKQIAEDEDRFLDREKLKVAFVDDVKVTT